MVKVSVIIPCYNLGEFIDEAVDSVFESTFRDFEIIIVNDGSTDELTNEKLNNYNKPHVKVITTKNQGVCAARNTAIANSTGIYILPLDADDRIADTYIEKAVRILDIQNNIGIVYPEVEFFGENGAWDIEEFTMKKMLLTNLIVVSGMYRKEDYIKTAGYDINLKEGFEDWDFWLSMLELGGKVYRIPEKLFYYRLRDVSRNSSIDPVKLNVLRRKIIKKHIDLYLQYLPDSISLLEQVQGLNAYKKSFIDIKNSLDYKIGRILLIPFRKIKSIFVR
ncbi:MAG: glycosyltransferase family A protein [Bacteroidota bacterium]